MLSSPNVISGMQKDFALVGRFLMSLQQLVKKTKITLVDLYFLWNKKNLYLINPDREDLFPF